MVQFSTTTHDHIHFQRGGNDLYVFTDDDIADGAVNHGVVLQGYFRVLPASNGWSMPMQPVGKSVEPRADAGLGRVVSVRRADCPPNGRNDPRPYLLTICASLALSDDVFGVAVNVLAMAGLAPLYMLQLYDRVLAAASRP